MLDTNIILIGPLAAGKTTLAKLLGAALSVPVIELDDSRWAYYAEIGYDPEHAERLRREGGLQARSVYWKPFEIYHVERILQDYPAGYVLSFGAGNSVADDPQLLARLQQVLAAYPYVVLLLPSPDVDEALRLLMERFQVLIPDCPREVLEQITALNRYFVEHLANASLATHTVYTAGKSPAETCAEILSIVNLPRAKNAKS